MMKISSYLLSIGFCLLITHSLSRICALSSVQTNYFPTSEVETQQMIRVIQLMQQLLIPKLQQSITSETIRNTVFNPQDYANEEERVQSYEQFIAQQMSSVLAVVIQSLQNETQNDMFAKRLDLESLLSLDLPAPYQGSVNELVTQLLYCFFDANGVLKTGEPDTSLGNEAAALTVIQWLQRQFPEQYEEILNELPIPHKEKIVEQIQAASVIKQLEGMSKPSVVELRRDSFERRPHQRINKIHMQRDQNQKMIYQKVVKGLGDS